MTITPDDRSFIDQGKTFLKQEWHGSYEEEQTKMFLGLILTKYEELVSSGEAASNRDSSDEDESEDDQADSKQRTQRAEDHTCDREPLGLSSLQSDNAGHDSNDAGDDAPIEQELAKPGGEEQDRKDDTGDAGSQRRRGSFGVVAEVRIAGSHARPFRDSKSQFLRPYPKPGLSPDFTSDVATGVAPQEPSDAEALSECYRDAFPNLSPSPDREKLEQRRDVIYYALRDAGEGRTTAENLSRKINAALAVPVAADRDEIARNYWRSQGYDYDLHGLDGNSDYTRGYDIADAVLTVLSTGVAPVAVDKAKLAEVTRVTLVGRSGGRSAEHWDYAGVELSVQDDGRTLKVFPLGGDE